MVTKLCYGRYVTDVTILEAKLNILKSLKNPNITLKDNLSFITYINLLHLHVTSVEFWLNSYFSW